MSQQVQLVLAGGIIRGEILKLKHKMSKLSSEKQETFEERVKLLEQKSTSLQEGINESLNIMGKMVEAGFGKLLDMGYESSEAETQIADTIVLIEDIRKLVKSMN